jgi:ribosomal protein S27E
VSRLTPYHGSPLGVAECNDCGNQWACHLLAWGNPQHWSRCNVCGGEVWWTAIDDDGRELVPA